MLAIFDWDGTLCDSLERITRCFIAAARAHGLTPAPRESVIAQVGLPLEAGFAALYPEATPATRAALAGTYRDLFVLHDSTPMPLYPGVREGLDRLRRSGWQLAVATGKSRRGLDRAMAENGIESLFAATRCADESRPKPEPAMVRELLGITGFAANASVVIGDSVHDLGMARAAGVDALAVTWGACSTAQLAGLEPRATLDRFEEVVQWLIAALPPVRSSAAPRS